MTDKPIKEHYEVDSDNGIMVRTFDYIADLEKYCTSIEKDLLGKIASIQMIEKNFTEYMKSFETHRDELQAQLSAKEQEIERLNHLTRNSQAIDNKLLSANSTIESLRKRCEDLEAENKILQKYKDDTQPL